MAKSQETFNKKEKEKNRIKQRQEKKEKMAERKANAGKEKKLEDMLAYVDENGNLSSTPPDFSRRREIKMEDIQTSTPKSTASTEPEEPRTGVVTNFNNSKGFGFIKDLVSQESIFIHANELTEQIQENDRVQFEVKKTFKGLSAFNVKRVK